MSRQTHEAAAPRVAYIMSRFPKITETFVLFEMSALEDAGASVEIFPLLRHRRGPRHPEAATYERRAHFLPFLSLAILRANTHRLLDDPAGYLRLWWSMLRGTWGSLNFLGGALIFLPKVVLFADRMQALGVDHVHAHFASHPALAALAVHRLTGIPFSFTAHGSDLHVERRMLDAKVEEAAFVVAVSAYNRDLIVEECGEQVRHKIRIIHCGADSAVFKGAQRPADTNADSLRIVCVASLEEVKGHRYLLEACRLLRDRDVRIHCDLVGGGPLRARIEALVRELDIADTVHIHGPLPRPDVKGILERAHVAVLASCPTRSGKREGIPVALMEAMSCGLPVVASGVSGIPELVQDGYSGLLVPPGDPWSLADALARLASDPSLRCRLGATARRQIAAEFDLARGARLLLSEIEGVLRTPNT